MIASSIRRISSRRSRRSLTVVSPRTGNADLYQLMLRGLSPVRIRIESPVLCRSSGSRLRKCSLRSNRLLRRAGPRSSRQRVPPVPAWRRRSNRESIRQRVETLACDSAGPVNHRLKQESGEPSRILGRIRSAASPSRFLPHRSSVGTAHRGPPRTQSVSLSPQSSLNPRSWVAVSPETAKSSVRSPATRALPGRDHAVRTGTPYAAIHGSRVAI